MGFFGSTLTLHVLQKIINIWISHYEILEDPFQVCRSLACIWPCLLKMTFSSCVNILGLVNFLTLAISTILSFSNCLQIILQV